MREHDAVTEKVIAEKPIEKIKDKPYISITEAALFIGVSRPTIYLYLRNGEISAKRLGSKYLIAREDIENLFNNPDKFEGTLPNFRGKAKRMSNKTEMITVI